MNIDFSIFVGINSMPRFFFLEFIFKKVFRGFLENNFVLLTLGYI